MPMIEVSDEVAVRFAADAKRRGLTVGELLVLLADQLGGAAVENLGRRRLSFVGMGSSNSGRSARDADQTLAKGFGRD